MVLSMHDEASVAERAIRAGAHGYVVKREAGPRIVEAIRAVLSGKFHASASLSTEVAGRLLNRQGAIGGSPEDVLSDRELEVFRLRGQGRSTKEIADSMGVSVKTVGAYEVRIKEKLGLTDSGELLRQAVLWYERRRGV
jgi:DNA-binding NarL/FixJ family response regulator